MKTHFFNLNNMYFLKYLCKMLGSLTSTHKPKDSTLTKLTWTPLSFFDLEDFSQ